MTKTVTMMEKVTKIMMKSRYSPISGITWRQRHVMGTASVEQLILMFEIHAISTGFNNKEIYYEFMRKSCIHCLLLEGAKR